MTSNLKDKYLIVIAGPTAIGKTALGITLAVHFNTEIISADSRQIYKELNIGTAPPSIEELKTVHHHFIKTISVMDYYNASMFEVEVLDRLNELFRNHDIVFMVGGSTLYIDAVFHGIDDMPEVDMALRKGLMERYTAEGIEFLRIQLEKLDPELYKKIDLKNPYRMLKAIEISIMTGKPYSSHLTYTHKERDFNIIRIGVNSERNELHKKINARVDRMISNGLVNEVKNLEYARHTNALRTVGYREIFEYLDGTITLADAIEKIKIHTRQYAKRQITWFSRYRDMKWFPPEAHESIINYIQLKL